MDKFTAMRVFARVVETGNFTRAAETLAMPKATVTTFIQGLESQLKTKLLHRTTRQVNVTTDGALYYERAIRIIAEVDDLDASLSRSQGMPTGRLRVEMAGALSDSLLIPALSGFQEAYPDIQLDIGVSDRWVDYLAENVDCAIRAGTPTEQSLIARLVGEVRFLNCASPSYLHKYGVPAALEELKDGDHRFVGYLRAQTGQLMSVQLARGSESVEFRPNFAVTTSDTRSSMVAALQGMGIFQTPEMLAASAVADGRLVSVLPDWRRTPMPLYVVYPPNRHLSNKVRVFVDWIVKLLAEREQVAAEF